MYLHSISVQINSSHLLIAYYVPGTVPGILCELSYLLFQQPSKLGAIIVLILLRVEVSHRDELQSSFSVHGPVVSVFCLLYCTAFQRQVWKLRDQIETGVLGYKMT